MKHSMKKVFAAVMSVCTLAAAAPAAINASAYNLSNMPNYPGNNNVFSTSVVYSPSFGNIPKGYVSCSFQQSAGRYWMVDKNRDIRLIPANLIGSKSGYYISFETSKPIAKPSNYSQWTNSWGMCATWDQNAEMMTNVQSVYDYYKNTLGVSASDFNFAGSGTTLYASVTNIPGDARAQTHTNVSWMGFGQADSTRYCMGVDRGVVGHEFTHLYLSKNMNWYTDLGIETGAIMEAYCDVIGELSEDTPDWLVGGKTYINSSSISYKPFCIRNLKSPQYTNDPSVTTSSTFYRNYNTFTTALNNGSLNNVSNAFGRGSTVVSNAAYRMYNNGISKADMQKIWFSSLDYYPTDATHATMPMCASTVRAAAYNYFGQKYGYYSQNWFHDYQIVCDAFSAVGL